METLMGRPAWWWTCCVQMVSGVCSLNKPSAICISLTLKRGQVHLHECVSMKQEQVTPPGWHTLSLGYCTHAHTHTHTQGCVIPAVTRHKVCVCVCGSSQKPPSGVSAWCCSPWPIVSLYYWIIRGGIMSTRRTRRSSVLVCVCVGVCVCVCVTEVLIRNMIHPVTPSKVWDKQRFSGYFKINFPRCLTLS